MPQQSHVTKLNFNAHILLCLVMLAVSSPLALAQSRPDVLWMRGGHVDASTGLAYIENGEKLVSFSDAVIKIFRTSDGILLRSIVVPGSLSSAAFAVSIDGQKVAVGTSISGVHAIKILNLNDGSLMLTIPMSFPANSLSFSPVDDQIAAAGVTSGPHPQAGIWDSVDGSFIRAFSISGAEPIIGSVAFSPDGQLVAVDSILFNASTGDRIRAYGTFGLVSFSPDGLKLAIANGGSVTVFPVSCSSNCSAGFSAGGNPNSPAAFSPNSQLMAVNYSNGRIGVWNTANTAAGWSQANDYVITQNGYNISYGTRLAFAPDNHTLASAASQITLSNVTNGALISNLTPIVYSHVPSLAFSSDGAMLATVSQNLVNSDDSIRLWNAADGSRRQVSFTASIGLNISKILITPDNQQLLTLDAGNIKFWDATNGSLIRNIPPSGPGGTQTNGLALSPDGQIYAVGKLVGLTTPTTFFYRTADDSLVRTLSQVHGNGVFSPDGQLFAGNGSNGVKLFNASDGNELRVLNTNGDIAFSPDSETIAVLESVGVNQRTAIIKLFRVSDGALLQTLGTFNNWGASVAFAPDGQTIIATGGDATVRIWRLSDGVLLQTYDQETGVQINQPLFQIAYSPDGSRFAYGRRDATVVMASNPYNSAHDSTAPVMTPTVTGQLGDNGWYVSDVQIAWAVSDPESSIASTVGCENTSVTEDSSGVTFTCSATSGGGSATQSVTIKRDTTAPVITVTSPTNVDYLLNENVTVSFTCADSMGVAACNGTSANGGLLDTSSVGVKSFNVSASDLAGNSAVSTSVNYNVNFGLVVLFDQTKAHRSGSTVPIKIRLVDAGGVNVSSAETVVQTISLVQIGSQASTIIEEAQDSDSDFDFRYDQTLGGYRLNLQTKDFATGTYQLSFTAGSSPMVYSVQFQIRK